MKRQLDYQHRLLGCAFLSGFGAKTMGSDKFKLPRHRLIRASKNFGSVYSRMHIQAAGADSLAGVSSIGQINSQ